jgi:hypothetical protein
MSLRKAAHMLIRRRTLALTVLILGVAAATALAANVTGDGTLVGSTGPDNIAAGNGNDTIWGLGTPNKTTDNISAGYGNDQIDAGGHCTGVAPGDYPHGLPQSGACGHGPTPPNCGTANISVAGGGQNGGDDTIYGNCGPNDISISKGQGDGTIYSYGGPNNIAVNNGNWVIDLSKDTAGSNVSTGTGDDFVYAQNGQADTISCGSRNTIVYVDKHDKPSRTCTVKTSPQPASDVRSAAARHTARAHKSSKRHSKKAHAKRARHHG